MREGICRPAPQFFAIAVPFQEGFILRQHPIAVVAGSLRRDTSKQTLGKQAPGEMALVNLEGGVMWIRAGNAKNGAHGFIEDGNGDASRLRGRGGWTGKPEDWLRPHSPCSEEME